MGLGKSELHEQLDPTAILGALEPIVESEMSRWDAILFGNKTPSWFKGVAYYGGIDGSIAALLRRWQIKGAEAWRHIEAVAPRACADSCQARARFVQAKRNGSRSAAISCGLTASFAVRGPTSDSQCGKDSARQNVDCQAPQTCLPNANIAIVPKISVRFS